MLWLLITVVASVFVVQTAFMQLSSAKRLLASSTKLPLGIRLVSYFWLVVGYPADAIYNLTIGTIRFRELPKELLYSSRIQRLSNNASDTWRYKKAWYWRDVLNVIDPGHIH